MHIGPTFIYSPIMNSLFVSCNMLLSRNIYTEYLYIFRYIYVHFEMSTGAEGRRGGHSKERPWP